MSTYTVRLGVATPPATTMTTIFTAPSTGTIVVRDVCAHNGGTAATQVIVQIASASGSQLAVIYRNPAVAAATSDHLELRQVLEPGEQLQVFAGAAGCSFAVTGYNLA